MRSSAKFASRAVQKVFSKQGGKFLLKANPQAIGSVFDSPDIQAAKTGLVAAALVAKIA